jgi:predicted permease
VLHRILSFLRATFLRRSFEANMHDELHFHRERFVSDLMASGTPAAEARRRAALEFGSSTRIEEECREARGLSWLDEFSRQSRYAWRLLYQSPAFTITALLTIALCFGANLSVFAVIDSVLLRPLPFPKSQELVSIYNTYPKAGVLRDGSSITNYYERRGHLSSFSSVSIYRLGTATVGEPGSTERSEIAQVSADFFKTLAHGPVLGRAFHETETTFKTDDVVILTDRYWLDHYQRSPKVIGQLVRVDGTPKTVVGILPPGFRFLSSKAQLYFPLASSLEQRAPSERHSGGNSIQMIARLAPGVSIEQAQSEVDSQNNALAKGDPMGKRMAEAGFRSLVLSLHADQVETIKPVAWLLQTAVFLLLLIGLVNLVNLLLVRANGRLKELAIRQALGASARHLVAETCVEVVILTILGSALGYLFAAAAIPMLNALGADRLPLGAHIVLDLRLILIGMLITVAMAVLLALPIAWFNLRSSLNPTMNAESRGGTSNRAAQALRHSFVVAQIALAFVLLSGAGLLTKSLQNITAISPGFQPEHAVAGQISLPGRTYPNEASGLAFAERILSAVKERPGVSLAGLINNVPFSGHDGKSAATVQGYVLQPGQAPRGHYSYGVAGNYFQALGIPLRKGRFLAPEDSHRDIRVCVVDEDFARYYWPNANPLGKRLFQGSQAGKDSEAFTVVGVVAAVKQAGLGVEEGQGAVYYPYSYRASPNFFLVTRGALSTDLLALNLEKAVRQVDPDIPVADVQSMDSRIAESLVVRRSPALLASGFAALAVLLTAIGTYGVLSYAVGQRQREIGIRMAIGARPSQIGKQFLASGFTLIAFGGAAGIPAAWAAGRAMQVVLFHVPPIEYGVFVGSLCILALVGVLACLVPSSRAARTSPLKSLQLG